MKKHRTEIVKFTKLIPGGQALGQLDSGKKVFAWGVLPGETAEVQITKNKKTFIEGYATTIIESSDRRILPQDPQGYLSTSPWQIMDYNHELEAKQLLVNESFNQEKIQLTPSELIYTDGNIFNYRNKVEFSFWWEKDNNSDMEGELSLAFFRRGGRGKIPVNSTSLARNEINQAGQKILELLRKNNISSRDLKTVLIRSSQKSEVAAQLYVKTDNFPLFDQEDIASLGLTNFDIIYSNPKSPASVITKKLYALADESLSDKILGINFNYATEGFFQINLPVYEQALKDIRMFVDKSRPTVDLYSGVGTIGLTVSNSNLTMVESNPSAVAEMERNIKFLGRESSTRAVLSRSEQALEYISKDANLIVDPPRAGLDKKVCTQILQISPPKVIYLSCNPATQARDIAILSEKYNIIYARSYNFFPRTPHIEHLVVLELKTN